ncbi:aspartic peptidase domain-containing protein [Xylariomycetidae sp. FL2044]|nr:aspartic peptidase domain-containing protein [Xylariomycetidae sp. FL2044]
MIFTLPLLAAWVIAARAADQRVVPVTFGRQQQSSLPLLHRRAGQFSQELNNNLTGGGYYTEVSLGTPPQNVTLILDTGSSDIWVLATNATLCHSASLQAYYGGCIATYDPSASDTYSLVSEDDFNIQYADGSGAEGDYFKDTFHIGGAAIDSLQMGLAENTTINSGLLGIGFAANVAANQAYPNIIDLLVDQNLIDSQAYSLYLDDLYAETGTILFGGLDTQKFIGELKSVPIQPDEEDSDAYSSFTVTLSSLTSTDGNGTVTNYTRSSFPVILDSGTTLTYLPNAVTYRIFDAIGAVDDTSRTQFVYVSCDYLSQNLTFDFQFGDDDGPVIHVPADEVVLDNVKAYVDLGLRLPDLPFENVCSFGMQPSSSYYLLGDTFLRSAYVVYDLTNKEIALAPANLNSTESNVIEITSASGIPNVSGVASQATVASTATSAATASSSSSSSQGDDTETPTAATVTSATSSADQTGSAGAKAVPVPNWEVVVVAGIAGLSGLMGVGVFVV